MRKKHREGRFVASGSDVLLEEKALENRARMSLPSAIETSFHCFRGLGCPCSVCCRLPDRHIPNSGVHRQHVGGFDVIERIDRTGEMLQQAEARAAMLGIVPPYLRSDFRTQGDSSDSIDLPPLAASS